MTYARDGYDTLPTYSARAQLMRDCDAIRHCIKMLAEAHARTMPDEDRMMARSRSNALLLMLEGNLRRLEQRGHLSAAEASAWRAYAESKREVPPPLRVA